MGKEGRGGREGRVREGMEEGRGKGKRGTGCHGRDGTGHGMGREGKGGRGGKGGEGLQPQTSIPSAATGRNV